MKKSVFVFVLFFLSATASLQAQEAPALETLPEYLVIMAEDADLFSITYNIQSRKKSKNHAEVKALKQYLSDQRDIRTVSDLLNEMHDLGYEFQNAFTSNSNADIGIGKVIYNLVFRKAK